MLTIISDTLIAAFAAFGITAFLWLAINGFVFRSKKESGKVFIITDSVEKQAKIHAIRLSLLQDATVVFTTTECLREELESFSKSI